MTLSIRTTPTTTTRLRWPRRGSAYSSESPSGGATHASRGRRRRYGGSEAVRNFGPRVTAAERDLVEALRSELASIDPPRRCCRVAEEAGLAGAFEPRRRAIARLTLRLGRGRAGEKTAVAESPVPGTALPVADATSPGLPGSVGFDWLRAADHCRVAYLRGRLLAHGSL